MNATKKDGPPFRADHVGSLLRPDSLRRAFRDHAEGKIDDAAFANAQDDAIREIVTLQEDVGLRSITDGEFRRASYWSHFAEGIDGLAVAPARFEFHDQTGHAMNFLAPHVVGKLRRARSLSGGEFDFLKNATARTPKITLPSPPTLHFWDKENSLKAAGYADDGAFFADVARIFQDEIADLAKRGAKYIQIDDVPLAMLCDESLRARMSAAGENPEAALTRYVELFNACLATVPDDMTVALHVCRGNFKGHWLSEGGYGRVARRMFNEIDVDSYFLEFDSPRAGDFSPLANVPRHKSVVLGIVSTKTATLESANAVKRRIDEAAAVLPLDQLALSPQCGFASAVSGNPITANDEIHKLRLVVEIAADVWGYNA
jgi:5-methyltetrahydropteroyltriglutamate--homocysteine methyltransferase